MRLAIASSNSHARTLIAETETVFGAQTRPAPTLGDLPLTVISHGQLVASALPPNLDVRVREGYEQAWQKLQVEITSPPTAGAS